MLMEEHSLKVFENRVKRIIFESERYKVTGGWRKLHSEELHNLYSSTNIIRVIKSRRMRWEEHVAQMRQMRSEYKLLVVESEGKRSLGRPRLRWKDNIKIDLREVGFGDVDWIHLAQDMDK
jgi:hypothetical protein